jgi:hypothetical protein
MEAFFVYIDFGMDLLLRGLYSLYNAIAIPVLDIFHFLNGK